MSSIPSPVTSPVATATPPANDPNGRSVNRGVPSELNTSTVAGRPGPLPTANKSPLAGGGGGGDTGGGGEIGGTVTAVVSVATLFSRLGSVNPVGANVVVTA